MTKSSVIKKLAICAFTVAATATFSSLAGQAQAQVRPPAIGPAYNADGNLPVGGYGAPVVQGQGSSGQRPPGGAGYNAGGNLPLGGFGSPIVVGVNDGTMTNPPANGGGNMGGGNMGGGKMGGGNMGGNMGGGNMGGGNMGGGNQGGGNMGGGNQGGGNMGGNMGGPRPNPNVPEPVSVLGSLAAIGFGTKFMLKRKQMLANDEQA